MNLQRKLTLVVLFSLPVIIYLPALKSGFVYFDDNQLILQNEKFLSDFSNTGKAFLTDAFATRESHFYRPLQIISYMIDLNISGSVKPAMIHLHSILLAGIISVVIFFFFLKLNIPDKLAFAGALIYVIHPLFVSVIIWIPGRGDLLLTLFSLLSFLFLMNYGISHAKRYIILCWISFTLALFSKETAIGLPLLFIIYLYSIRFHKKMSVRQLPWLLLFLISLTGWLFIRTKAVGDFAGLTDIIARNSGSAGLSTIPSNLRTIPESLFRFFIPAHIEPIPGYTLFRTLGGILLLLILISACFLKISAVRNKLIFCFLWFLLLIFPTLVFKNGHIDYLDHRFFLPLTGIWAYVLLLIPAKWPLIHKKMYYAIVILIITGFGMITYLHSGYYKDMMTYYNRAVAANPQSVFALNNRGAALHSQGDFENAMKDYSKAIELEPGYAEAFFSRGNANFNLKYYGRAIEDYSKAIDLGYITGDVFNNRGVAYIRQGKVSEGCANFSVAAGLGSQAALVNKSRFCK